MRLGLLADIHESNDHLRMALGVLRQERVDQIVVLGDVLDVGKHIEECCELLREVGAIGVWGNHEFGLCQHPDEGLRRNYSQSVREFMASLSPYLEIEGCLFQHIEPWLDPYEIVDLWNFDGLPYSTERLAKSFAAAKNRLMFMGHLHHYFAATPARASDWRGEKPIRLEPENRYLIGLAAVCDGNFAIFDTTTCELFPWNSQ
jgi:hypothetical protein